MNDPRNRNRFAAALLVFLFFRLFHVGLQHDMPPAQRLRGSAWPVRLDPTRASWRELSLLPGIGEVGARALAEKLLGIRRRPRLADLIAVPGIGPITASRIAPHLDLAMVGESVAGENARRRR